MRRSRRAVPPELPPKPDRHEAVLLGVAGLCLLIALVVLVLALCGAYPAAVYWTGVGLAAGGTLLFAVAELYALRHVDAVVGRSRSALHWTVRALLAFLPLAVIVGLLIAAQH